MASDSGADGKRLLRKSSSSKMVLKEKVVQIYEIFFQGDDPSTDKPNFWDEFFLLKVNFGHIETEFDKLSSEALLALKENLNMLFYKAVQTLKEENPIRVINALHTLCALIRGVFKKSVGDFGFDVINILIGFDSAESVMQIVEVFKVFNEELIVDIDIQLSYILKYSLTMVENLNRILIEEYPVILKHQVLKFLQVLATATDNISQNTLLEYILINSVFESLIQILGNAALRQILGHETVLVLTLFVQYRKYESANQYIVKLSILDDELALTGYAQVVHNALYDFNRSYVARNIEPQGGWFSALASMVGNMFVADEKQIAAVRANDSILLALYEAIHLNRNFITALTHTLTPSTPATPPSSVLTSGNPLINQAPPNDSTLLEPTCQPTNLLVTFLEYSSIVMQDTKDEIQHNNAKLCLIILTCISEDQYANSLMHDINMNFQVSLHRMPMRHRKMKVEKDTPSRPLVCAVLDLMVEFIMSHMMKTFPLELYLKCLGITHRVLCYQKKCRVRIQYPWKELWTALINLLKFILSNEGSLVKRHNNIFHLSSKIMNIFNTFITYGDTFLPNPNSYDELYYEIIRMHQVFDNIYSMALRYTTNDGESKDSAARLTNHLVNIRAIVNHFTPKVDAWAASQQLSSLTEEQVLEVVRANYDTLTLKLQDSLDQFERYSEKPREMGYFTQLVRSITVEVRKTTNSIWSTQTEVLHSLSSIT